MESLEPVDSVQLAGFALRDMRLELVFGTGVDSWTTGGAGGRRSPLLSEEEETVWSFSGRRKHF